MPRIKKPTNVHILNGNPSKIPAAKLVDSINPLVEAPDMPDFLNAEARKEWLRITPILLEQGILTKLDRAALAAYCQSYGHWVNAELEITARGNTGLYDEAGKMTGLLRHSQIAYGDMRKFAQEFGITPVARSRVQIAPKAAPITVDPKDPGRFFTTPNVIT